jgi:hypothetical protein
MVMFIGSISTFFAIPIAATADEAEAVPTATAPAAAREFSTALDTAASNV